MIEKQTGRVGSWILRIVSYTVLVRSNIWAEASMSA